MKYQLQPYEQSRLLFGDALFAFSSNSNVPKCNTVFLSNSSIVNLVFRFRPISHPTSELHLLVNFFCNIFFSFSVTRAGKSDSIVYIHGNRVQKNTDERFMRSVPDFEARAK